MPAFTPAGFNRMVGAGSEGMFCAGKLGAPIAKEGFVVSTIDPTLALECAFSEACLGGNGSNGSYCNTTYTGNRCARCVEGAYMINKECRPCGNTPLIWIFGVIFPCVLVLGAHLEPMVRTLGM